MMQLSGSQSQKCISKFMQNKADITYLICPRMTNEKLISVSLLCSTYLYLYLYLACSGCRPDLHGFCLSVCLFFSHLGV